MQTQNLAKINNVAIQMVSDSNEKFIPIRPICEALGIDIHSQRKRIERDEILNSVGVIMTATGTDKKQYEMYCIPFKFVFGWLFTIDTSRINEDAREAVIKYKLECYNVLYNHFTSFANFVDQKQSKMEEQLSVVKEAKANFTHARNTLYEAEKKLQIISKLTIEDYDTEKNQLKLEFKE